MLASDICFNGTAAHEPRNPPTSQLLKAAALGECFASLPDFLEQECHSNGSHQMKTFKNKLFPHPRAYPGPPFTTVALAATVMRISKSLPGAAGSSD